MSEIRKGPAAIASVPFDKLPPRLGVGKGGMLAGVVEDAVSTTAFALRQVQARQILEDRTPPGIIPEGGKDAEIVLK
ncbi:MAG: hypothetical protein KGI70_03525 [Patescibacteria group bacterium]|nr:hypothetical protein [Patescibacteria group bacterium]